MKHFFSLIHSWAAVCLFLILAGPVARAQAPAWQMLTTPVHGSGVSNTAAYAISANDATGNVYIVGQFFGTASFGTTVLTSAGGGDVFVAKWSAASNGFVWAQRAGGLGSDRAMAVAVAGANVYVTGAFSSSTADFGSATLANGASPTTSADVFVAKLTDAGSSGSFAWALRAGGTTNDIPQAIAVNGPNVYVTGRYESLTASFGTTVLNNAGAANTADVFVAKLLDAGTTAGFVWAQKAGGPDYDGTTALAVQGSSLYVAGSFASPNTTFGTISLANTTADGKYDGFVAKLTDAGTAGAFTWVRGIGGTGSDGLGAVAVSGTTVYIGGAFASPTVSVGTTVLTNQGLFVAKLLDTGTSSSFGWATQTYGTGTAAVRALAVRGTSVYAVGTINGAGTVNFGSTTLTNTLPAAPAPSGLYLDGFMTRLTDAGSYGFDWVKQVSSPEIEELAGVALVGATLYTTGSTNGSASFDNLTVANPTSVPFAILASLTDPTLTATSPALSGAAFTLYPNPAHRATIVQLPALPGTATATLTLRDALGRALRTATVALPAAGLRQELDLGGLPAGIYALQVQAGPATATRRLVVEQ